MAETTFMEQICVLSNRRHKLYRELDRIIQSGRLHLGRHEQPQSIEIQEITDQLVILWEKERARGKLWVPRLGTAKYASYNRPLERGLHGYGRH